MHLMLFSVLAFAALLLPTKALYFYIDGPSQKCFFEELPKDTLVVGEYLILLFLHAANITSPNINITFLASQPHAPWLI